MRRLLLALALVVAMAARAQSDSIFHAYIYNDEYKVYMEINFYSNDVIVPQQEIFGPVPGYFGAVRDSRKWLVTSARLSGKNTARLEIVNDYGSQDLTATLSYNPKTRVYTLRQEDGNRLKIVVDRKWLKIPAEIELVPHERVRDGF